jgi:hypothetical protein
VNHRHPTRFRQPGALSCEKDEPPFFPPGLGRATFTLVRQKPWRTVSAFHRLGFAGCPARVNLPDLFEEGIDSLTVSPSLRPSAPSRVRPCFLPAETRIASDARQDDTDRFLPTRLP